MSKYPEIDNIEVGINPRDIQQAAATLLGAIIEAQVTKHAFGENGCIDRYGKPGDVPRAGEVTIGKVGNLVVKMTIEPGDVDAWSGAFLTHDEIDAIGINNMTVDGRKVKS